MIAEAAAKLKAQGKTLFDRLLELYQEHGYFQETLIDIFYPGADGFGRMQAIMEKLRTDTPNTVGTHRVTAVTDYMTLQRVETASGETSPVDCITGNVVVLELDDNPRRRLVVRPSGTESKLKVYTMWYEDYTDGDDIRSRYEQIDRELRELGKTLQDMLLA